MAVGEAAVPGGRVGRDCICWQNMKRGSLLCPYLKHVRHHEENDETICTIEDGETFSLDKPFRSQRQALGPKGLFLKCVDIHASFTSKVKNVHYFFMTVDDRTDISVLWVQ